MSFWPYGHSKNEIKICLNFSYYAVKSTLKSATDSDSSDFAEKIDLASLKSEGDKSDIGILETGPVDLSKLSGVIQKRVLKRLNIMNWLKKLMLFKLLILLFGIFFFYTDK